MNFNIVINKIKKICFLKIQADLKTNCTRLWCFVLIIIYNKKVGRLPLLTIQKRMTVLLTSIP